MKINSNLRVRQRRQGKLNSVVSLRCKRADKVNDSDRLNAVANAAITATNDPMNVESMDLQESE